MLVNNFQEYVLGLLSFCSFSKYSPMGSNIPIPNASRATVIKVKKITTTYNFFFLTLTIIKILL